MTFDFFFEENGRRLKFLIRIEYFIDAIVEEYVERERRLQKELKDGKNEDAQKELDELRTEWKESIKEEEERLDRFCNILCTSDKTYTQAEREGYGFIDSDKFADVLLPNGKRIEDEEKDEEDEDDEEEKKEDFTAGCYLEKKLSAWDKDALMNRGYMRLKVSPDGKGGAAFYWVKPRYNESKEHAFFCYLVEAEVKKHRKKPEMRINNGPDVSFEFNKKWFAFDVETGSTISRNPDTVRRKYERYEKDYYKVFIFVTEKRFKKRYSKFGTVITRAQLKETIRAIFAPK